MTELVTSGVVANLELWERSEVLFPSFYPSFFPLSSPSVPSFPLPSPLLLYLVAIISMIFLRINSAFTLHSLTLHFFTSLLGGTLLYTVPPCPDIIWGNDVPPQNIWGNSVLPRSPSTTPLLVIRPCSRILQITPYFFKWRWSLDQVSAHWAKSRALSIS